MTHYGDMRIRHVSVIVGLIVMLGAVGSGALLVSSAPAAQALSLQQNDTEVPPGNPVIGSDRPGDIEQGERTDYWLWAIVALCLIGAGVLLVKVERWESKRRDSS